jgi:murein DD-endopeptidase MepM/ murein hydrolase activator NlpD
MQFSGTYEGASFSFAQPIRVQSGGYASETLTVGEEFLNPEVSDAESAMVHELLSPATPEKLWTGQWEWPHPYVNVINSEYGLSRLYNGGAYEGYHYGVDFGGGVGIEIFAPAAGRVVFAGPMEVRGNATFIDHGWGIYTAYFHQSQLDVAEGDLVQPGQLIGLVGGTGRVSGAHLHWEVWANGEPIQPLDWLNRVFP